MPAPAGPVLDLARRGSHATPSGQGFGWLLSWTILGALVPGTGLLAAGLRRTGAAVVGGFVLGGLVLAVLALRGDALRRGMTVAVDPGQLLLIAVVAAVVGVAWAALILATSLRLGRYATLTNGQRAFSGLVVAALIAAVGLPAYKVGETALIGREVITSNSVFAGDSDAGSGPEAEKPDPWANQPRMNVLLIGSDAGEGREGIRPDTMILASIDTKSGATVLFSLPRSLQKTRFAPGTPGARAWPNGYDCGSECLINAIWRWAEGDGRQYYKGRNPGLRATEDAVHGVTGLKVDTYVMLNLNGFRDFVNAIGGIRVNVNSRLPIGGNSTVGSPLYHVATGGWIEPGRNKKLDGYHALWYARSRWASDDYDRMQRQRCAIGAIVKKANPTTLALNFPKIAKALEKNLATGIDTGDLQAWVELSLRVKNSSVTSLPFTNEVISTVDPDYDTVHALVKKSIRNSVRAARAKAAEEAVTAGATAAPSPGATTAAPRPKKAKATADPSKAQDVAAVC